MKIAGMRHATALKAAGNPGKAVLVYKEILALKPAESIWAQCALASALLEMQNREQAQMVFAEALQASPDLMESEKFKPYQNLATFKPGH
jgi:tetratricopeptide (TPR) repeat protein